MQAGDFDEDGLREVATVAASDARRRQRETSARDRKRVHQDELRAAFAAGKLTMAEYAKQAREAGIAASEVGAALQERAAAERRLSQQAESAAAAAQTASSSGEQPPSLVAALAAKAQGLERLRGGQHADAAAAFADGADLCGRAKEQLGQAGGEALEAHAASVRTVRTACLLNEALCRLKLEEWSAAEHACTSVIEEEKTASTKALYRRGTARLRLGLASQALADLEQAAALSPTDKEVRKLLEEARAIASPTAPDTDAPTKAASSSSSAISEVPMAPPPPMPPPSLEKAHGSLTPDVAARSYCFLAISIGGHAAGRLTFQLFDDLLPRTSANFRALCNGVRALLLPCYSLSPSYSTSTLPSASPRSPRLPRSSPPSSTQQQPGQCPPSSNHATLMAALGRRVSCGIRAARFIGSRRATSCKVVTSSPLTALAA